MMIKMKQEMNINLTVIIFCKFTFPKMWIIYVGTLHKDIMFYIHNGPSQDSRTTNTYRKNGAVTLYDNKHFYHHNDSSNLQIRCTLS